MSNFVGLSVSSVYNHRPLPLKWNLSVVVRQGQTIGSFVSVKKNLEVVPRDPEANAMEIPLQRDAFKRIFGLQMLQMIQTDGHF